MKLRQTALLAAVGAALLATTLATQSDAAAAHARPAFVGPLHTVTEVASTVPANGDVNPYGVAVVPVSHGRLVRGNVLVSNFNNSANLQGTGHTIVQISPAGAVSQFADIDPAHLPGACPGGVGLTTALSVLRSGWVVVGSLPTTDGTSATAQAGCLIVLDSNGTVRETISGRGINGPWDQTALDYSDSYGYADLFVTNVLNGTVAANGNTVNGGTVLRIRLHTGGYGAPVADRPVVVGSGFGERTDPAALVVGPTGVGLAANGTLYVADSVGNRVAAIPGADSRSSSGGTGRTLTSGGALNTPLGLAVAPDGDVLTVNAADGNLVDTTAAGVQAAVRTLDATGTPPGAGTLFGLAVRPGEYPAVYFVDDGTNQLNLLS